MKKKKIAVIINVYCVILIVLFYVKEFVVYKESS